MADITTSPIALAAQDELPETWVALRDAQSFGPAALERRLVLVQSKLFGAELTQAEEDELSPVTATYAGILLALDLIIPGIDYWSKQALSHSAGDRESKAYKDRAEDLKGLRDLLFTRAAELRPDVEADLPAPKRAGDMMRVQEAGLTTLHVTPDPLGFPSIYGPPEDVIAP